MAKFDLHPTVKWWQEQSKNRLPKRTDTLNSASLRKLCLEMGADDVGFVEIDRPALSDRADILAAFPPTKTLISFVCCMNRENVRTPARSIANQEFHANYDHADEIARNLVKALEQIGVRALNPSVAFPMEMDRFPGKVWVVSHKLVAVAAGLGHMGIHRNVIHPKFGNFIALGTVSKLQLLFQRDQSAGLNAIYHFTFTGSESRHATVKIQNKTLEVLEGHIGTANLSVTADSQTWLGFLAKEKNLVWALLRGKIRIGGSPKLLQAFGKCFPA